MSTMFNRFEIQSELSKSENATIYKALDKETNQVVALKTQSLAPLGDHAAAFVDALIVEGQKTRDLVAQNIVPVFGAGEMDGQFSAAMEYIQGNSVATMLARKEGFSIWDILDITRQLCAGLEQAAAKNVAHCSLEPSKILVQWDGMVKILGYGISRMSLMGAECGNGLGQLTPYCSPEQIRGEAVDSRSNLFSIGAILYEMVAGRKAFNATDMSALFNQIENEMPASPTLLNPKILPAVSALILKALAKDPAARYQHARELLEDLEKCKETKKAIVEPKKITPPIGVAIDPAMRASAAAKFVSSGAPEAAVPTAPAQPPPGAATPAATRPRAAIGANSIAAESRPKASAAAASGSGAGAKIATAIPSSSNANSGISEFEVSSTPSQIQAPVQQSAPIMTDPMMAAVAAPPLPGSGRSFSDLAEMPPLKEPVFVSPPPEPVQQSSSTVTIYPKKDVKPKIQPREVADKAIREIVTLPPRLMLYAILGAVALILVVAVALYFHVRSEDDGSTAAPHQVTQAASPKPVVPPAEQSAPPARPSERLAVDDGEQPAVGVRQAETRAGKKSKRAAAPAPVAVAVTEALIDSDPQGAQIQIDGKSDPAYVTPFNVTGLSAGKHILSANKTGFASEIRALEVSSSAKASLTFHLSPLNAMIVVTSVPAGAAITIDGQPTGKVTPAQFSSEKGSHSIVVKKNGYLDETVTADLAGGQNFQYAPTLKALGNVENIKTVGKMNKLFKHGADSSEGMGSISIHTQPKGAQIVINQRVLDKFSPLDVMLGPGNYVIDLTMTGFKPVHKVISVERGSKALIEEILQRE